MKKVLIGFLLSVLAVLPAFGQSFIASTNNRSVVITTGGVFQSPVGLSTAVTSQSARRSLTIQNNNTDTSENCWVYVGATGATAGKSILLSSGQGYTRYYPYVPADVIQVTCNTSLSTMYVDFN